MRLAVAVKNMSPDGSAIALGVAIFVKSWYESPLNNGGGTSVQLSGRHPVKNGPSAQFPIVLGSNPSL